MRGWGSGLDFFVLRPRLESFVHIVYIVACLQLCLSIRDRNLGSHGCRVFRVLYSSEYEPVRILTVSRTSPGNSHIDRIVLWIIAITLQCVQRNILAVCTGHKVSTYLGDVSGAFDRVFKDYLFNKLHFFLCSTGVMPCTVPLGAEGLESDVMQAASTHGETQSLPSALLTVTFTL